MSSSRKRFLKTAVILITIASAFYYLIFYDWMDYFDGQVRCYSPNHEFYVLSKISLFTYVAGGETPPTPGNRGTVKLYDKNDKLLFSARGVDLYNGGPNWHDNSYSDKKNIVYYSYEGEFKFELPASPCNTEHCWLPGCH